jgi:SAM-dependent MidA family methyltransferase
LLLRDQIEREIREHGPIPFSRYMELCLYDPENGYYSRNAEQFGKAGDFYTSSDVHAVFGRLLARQFQEMWEALDRPPQIEILELGPGRGLLARDVLDWSRKKFPDFFAAVTCTLQESSLALRARLEKTLLDYLASDKVQIPTPPVARTQICRSLSPGIPLIVFANEFFDALPVEILSQRGKLHVAFGDNLLQEVWLLPTPEEIEFLDRCGVHPEPGERIEVSLGAQDWAARIASAICSGLLVAIDYGYTRNEQLAGRHRGTLMTYCRHSTSTNPYEAPGEQDITAHVNFSALTAAVEQGGMRAERLRTQAQVLMGIGEKNHFGDAFEDCRLPQEQAKVSLQLKHLVTPAGLGETFRVLLASRGIEPIKIATLSGLTFGGV